ncbi:uncharacterized protein LOC112683810 isoform X2 [Sipha flava]|uniref:Uncharacterized protein LOC112683810 isoform X2 n=1 Tax=Sipha flava TaxID=143950 RepID=A0A2S2QXU8_9HEMI|nr:uncharacterized protein LOC112683810 isoform X2 [Sipha flava]
MASLPQPKFEPKAPDKSSPAVCDVSKKIQESDCSNNNKSKSLSLDLSNLNTASFKNLLEEVVAYDTAKQTKSELYNNLLEDVTQNGEDDVKRPLLNQRLVDSQTDLDKLSSKDQHIKENSSLEAFDLAPDFKKRLSGVSTKVSARQLEGGSLPSHVNHAQALSVLINKKNIQNNRKKIAESSKMAKNVDKVVDLGNFGYEQVEEKDMSNYTSHASLEIFPVKDETKIDDRLTTPLLTKQSSQNYEDHDAYMEIDASPYTKDSKDVMTKVLPRTSGEGDQGVKNLLHQPATVVTDFNKDAQMIDHQLFHLFGSQINCYQNPYNGYTPPLNFHFLTPNDNLGLQTAYSNNRKNNFEDTSNATGHKRNKQKKELRKKDEVVRSEDIQGYRGDKNIDEILKFIGDKSSDSKKNKGSKTKNKIKSRNGKGSDDDCERSKNQKMKMTKYNSVEEVSITVFQHMDSSDDESKSIKSNKKQKKKVTKQNKSSKKFASTEQRLDVLSSESQDTDSADFLLVTNKQRRKKQKSQNKLNSTTSNFPPHDSYLLSQYTQPKTSKNKKRRKSTSSMPHSDKSEDNSDLDSVHSLPASSTPSKQPSYKEAPKTDLIKPVCVVTTSEESIPTVTIALPLRNVDIASNVNDANECVNGDVHVTYIVHESQRADLETAKKTVVLNKVPAPIPSQSASLTVRVPSKKKQSPIMYNKYEVDTSLSFGFEIDQNLLCDNGDDYSPPVPIPMPIEYNYREVILFIKQAWQDVEKEKINGRSNILEYKRDNSSVSWDI